MTASTLNSATHFTGYVKQLPSLQRGEKLVLSQVLVPPLAKQYDILKREWVKQELWRDDKFVEMLAAEATEKGAEEARIAEAAVEQYLTRHLSDVIRKLKASEDPRWKLLLVESFETGMCDPPVSSNVERYIIPPDDPCVALRGQLGLRATSDSEIFVIGIYRCRTMLDVPTFQERERVRPPEGFPGSVYKWVLKLDQYVVDDGHMFYPHWMTNMPASKKKKTNAQEREATMWQEGYQLIHSAFGYGNETALANDPHEQPYTRLDNPDAVGQAEACSNTCVKTFRIGPWVFPVELTLKLVTVGTPLMYCYGRDYWSGIRGSTALANLSDSREAQLQYEIKELKSSKIQLVSDNEQLRSSNLALQLQLKRALQSLKGNVCQLHAENASLDKPELTSRRSEGELGLLSGESHPALSPRQRCTDSPAAGQSGVSDGNSASMRGPAGMHGPAAPALSAAEVTAETGGVKEAGPARTAENAGFKNASQAGASSPAFLPRSPALRQASSQQHDRLLSVAAGPVAAAQAAINPAAACITKQATSAPKPAPVCIDRPKAEPAGAVPMQEQRQSLALDRTQQLAVAGSKRNHSSIAGVSIVAGDEAEVQSSAQSQGAHQQAEADTAAENSAGQKQEQLQWAHRKRRRTGNPAQIECNAKAAAAHRQRSLFRQRAVCGMSALAQGCLTGVKGSQMGANPLVKGHGLHSATAFGRKQCDTAGGSEAHPGNVPHASTGVEPEGAAEASRRSPCDAPAKSCSNTAATPLTRIERSHGKEPRDVEQGGQLCPPDHQASSELPAKHQLPTVQLAEAVESQQERQAVPELSRGKSVATGTIQMRGEATHQLPTAQLTKHDDVQHMAKNAHRPVTAQPEEAGSIYQSELARVQLAATCDRQPRLKGRQGFHTAELDRAVEFNQAVDLLWQAVCRFPGGCHHFPLQNCPAAGSPARESGGSKARDAGVAQAPAAELQSSMPAPKANCPGRGNAEASGSAAAVASQAPNVPVSAATQPGSAHDDAHTDTQMPASFKLEADGSLRKTAPTRAEARVGVHACAVVSNIVDTKQDIPAQPGPSKDSDVIWLSSDDESGDDEGKGINMSDRCPAVSAADNGSNDEVMQQEHQHAPDMLHQGTVLQSTPMTKLKSRKTTRTQTLGAASQHSIACPSVASLTGIKRGSGSNVTGPCSSPRTDPEVVDLTER